MTTSIDKRLQRLLRVALGGLVAGLLAGERAEAAGGQVEMELVSEVREMVPGRPFCVGLRLVHAPHWHTYWKNPGIVGVATSIDWDLPEGWEAGPIQWPQPKVVKMARVNAYGYEDEAILLVEMFPPKAWPGSGGAGTVTLKGRVAYMACATTCHPGFNDMELTLPVAADGLKKKPAWDPRWRAAFEATRATFAEESPAWSCGVRKVGDRIRLEILPEAAPPGESAPSPNPQIKRAYFFSTDDQVDSDAPQRLERREDGTLVLELRASRYGPEAPEDFPGILYSRQGWHQGGNVKAIAVRARWKDAS